MLLVPGLSRIGIWLGGFVGHLGLKAEDGGCDQGFPEAFSLSPSHIAGGLRHHVLPDKVATVV